jgi:NitT/TauT family transport system permease protein
MLHRRLYQFLMSIFWGLALCWNQIRPGLSDYVIPGPTLIWRPAGVPRAILSDVAGHHHGGGHRPGAVHLHGAAGIGICGPPATWFGSFIKVAAYNVQAYPIVALAPIIFILLGTDFSRSAHRRHDLLFPAAAVGHWASCPNRCRHRAFLPHYRSVALAVGS